jgi:membrane-associated protease RseP (regulator of RpoE activity)
LGYAVNQNLRILKLTGKALGQVVSGERSMRNTISGPIGIARESSRAVTEFGWVGSVYDAWLSQFESRHLQFAADTGA